MPDPTPRDRAIPGSLDSTEPPHVHTDACWEPDSGCDMGRNEAYIQPATADERAEIDEALNKETTTVATGDGNE